VAAVFIALFVNVLANNSWVRDKIGVRASNFFASTGFVTGFVGAGFMFLQIFLPLVRVSVSG